MLVQAFLDLSEQIERELDFVLCSPQFTEEPIPFREYLVLLKPLQIVVAEVYL